MPERRSGFWHPSAAFRTAYPLIGKKDASTFAGFFPADAPQYSIVCTIFTNTTTKPAYGGDVPAKAVKVIVNAL